MSAHDDIVGIEPARPVDIEKVFDYYVTTHGGLEDLAVRELKKAGAATGLRVHRRQRQGRVHFRYERSPARLLELRAVNGLFADLGTVSDITVGTPGLLRIAERILDVDIIPAVALHDLLHGPPGSLGIQVTCTISGSHRFSSSELQQILSTVLADRFDMEPDERAGPYGIHVTVEKRRARIGFRLGTPGERPYEQAVVRGMLPAPVAYAVAAYGCAKAGETWMDPVCGGNGILTEAGEDTQLDLLALDVEPRTVATTRYNAEAAGLHVRCAQWGGDHLPVKDGAVDCVVSDLSRRAGFEDVTEWLTTCRPVLRSGGRAVVLCERDRVLEAATLEGDLPYRLEDRNVIHVRGSRPSLYRFRAAD